MSNSNSLGINLYFSHSVERLADLLSDKIHKQQVQFGLFEPTNVLVPNSNMQRYLQLHLAKRKGVCAQVGFPFLETGLFQLTQQLTGQTKGHLNGEILSWKIWAFLKQLDSQGTDSFEPIQNYINGEDSDGLKARKQFQLSQKLAMLLLDYESQRPEMVRLWQNNQLTFKNTDDSYLLQLEVMQQDLYKHIVQSDTKQNTLLEVANSLHQLSITEVQPAVHVFTPSRISQLHRQLMLQMAKYMTVNIYQLNVCMDYWEDMQTQGELNWYQSQLTQMSKVKVEITDSKGVTVADSGMESGLFSELILNLNENELLQAWGKPGREALKLFSEIENDAAHYSIEFNDHWIEPEHNDPTVLHSIQSHIINRIPQAKAQIQVKHLNSLQFAVAPSVIREVEATYNSILWNLKQDPTLKLNEIAVLVTDMGKYRFVIEQVFESLNHQHQCQLKFAIVDSNAEVESQYAAAVNGLFKVLDDDFIRASLFEWFDNPFVQAANQFDQNDWYNWLFAVDELGIFCGYERLYESDNEVESGLYTWQNGLRQLRKSLILDVELTTGSAFLSAEKVGQLGVMIENLHDYQQRLKAPHKTVQWERIINDMLDALILVPESQGKEQVVQMTLQQALQKLAINEPELSLNYQDIKLFIQNQLQEIPANKGNYLSGGVVCAALQPMRPIPFKMTYILGLDEKTFPGQLNQETLDLTKRSRRIGDINVIENNQYLFLETLMCSREKLYLSYVGVDLVKDEVIEPSPVFITLKAYCDAVVDFTALPFTTYPISHIPLSSHENECFDDAEIIHVDWLVNFSYGDFLLNQTNNNETKLPVSITPQHQRIKEVYQAQLASKSIETESASESGEIKVNNISGEALAQYLINPQIAILKQLGIATKHEDDLSLLEQEPVKLQPLVKHQIFTQAVVQWIQQPNTADFNQLLQRHYQIELKKSKAPLGLFAELSQFSKAASLLESKLQSHLSDKTYLGLVQIGDGELSESAAVQVAAIDVKLKSDQKNSHVIQINSTANHVFSDGEVLTDLVVISSASKKPKWNSKLLSPFINWCMWQLSPAIKVAEVFNVHMVFLDQLHTVKLRPWFANEISFSSQSVIKQYLQNLVQNYLKGEGEFIPVELAGQLKLPKKSEPTSIKFSGLAGKVFMAFDELNDGDKAHMLDIYADKLKWPEYQEVLKAIEMNQSQQPWEWLKANLMPLYAMVAGKFNGSDGDLS